MPLTGRVRHRVAQLGLWRWTGLSLIAITAFLAMFVLIGADCLWLVAMGDIIRESGEVPRGIPFAHAPTDDWHNVPVAGELVMSWLYALGFAALPVAQVLVSVMAMAILAVGARRAGASDGATSAVVALVFLGSLSSLSIVRLQIFSIIPFVLLLLLLRREHRRPSRLVWLLLPMVAIWGNFHGAVLIGVAAAGCYLAFSRLRIRRAETLVVGPLTLLALMVNPAGFGTFSYYVGVLRNEAARRGEGLWGAPELSNPFDVLMGLAAVILFALAVRSRLSLWELAFAVALAVATLTTARQGLWLVMLLAAPAAVGLSRVRAQPGLPRCPAWPAGLIGVALAPIVCLPLVVSRGDTVLSADPVLVAEIAGRVDDGVVLAPEPLAESLAVADVKLWAVDPIDAFRPRDQVVFLDFLAGRPGARAAVIESDYVVVREGSAQDDLMDTFPGFVATSLPDEWLLYSAVT